MALKPEQELHAIFEDSYGHGSGVVFSRAPGRANLIGEHTDYNDGFVLPIALDRAVAMVGRATGAEQSRIYSIEFDEEKTFKVDDPLESIPSGWLRYAVAVGQVFAEQGYPLKNYDAIISGDVPIGSGLSSSAALEVAVAKFLEAVFDWEISSCQLALNCQQAEHRVGVNCGIMDQFTSVHAKDDHAFFLDCRTLEYKHVPFPKKDITVVMCDTGMRHNLADTEYNQRRARCYEAADHFKKHIPGLTALRDIGIEFFQKYESELTDIARKRARHVITENQRVLDSVEKLTQGLFVEFGELVNESHNSLRDDYEVSCDELDILVEAARKLPGTYGSRLVGAGFGGCTINLIKPDSVDEFCATVSDEYHTNFGRAPRIHTCKPSGGAFAKKYE